MSSVYASNLIFFALCPVATPARHPSRLLRSGCMHSANRIILKGHPCHMALLTGIHPTFSLYIRIDVITLEYNSLTRSTNHNPIPYTCRVQKSYWWEIQSKACAKSRLNMHTGVLVLSAKAMTSLIVNTASRIVFPATPQYCVVCKCSATLDHKWPAIILASSL
jgi:hypothetical protein